MRALIWFVCEYAADYRVHKKKDVTATGVIRMGIGELDDEYRVLIDKKSMGLGFVRCGALRHELMEELDAESSLVCAEFKTLDEAVKVCGQ